MTSMACNHHFIRVSGDPDPLRAVLSNCVERSRLTTHLGPDVTGMSFLYQPHMLPQSRTTHSQLCSKPSSSLLDGTPSIQYP
jgi:hypothetical protein